ncbi:tetratricopeptide repeat-containing diguanylate cyclase [Neptunicella sp.]|uniref:tetratricopeptide repeat-containing diguanylate cyclase n=1 Tax=Neptunicella sp. TaxID=2125986 RepID=UPI003F68CF53
MKSSCNLKLTFLLVGLFIFVSPLAADEYYSVDEILQQADDIRSRDSVQFDTLLAELSQKREQLSGPQQQYLDYLLAYQTAYSGNIKEAAAQFKAIANSDVSDELNFRANATLVNILAIAEEWHAAMPHFLSVLNTLPKIKDNNVRQVALISIALFYNILGKYELGLDYSTHLAEIASTKRNQCFASKLIVEAKLALHRITQFSSEVSDALALCEQADERLIMGEIQIIIAKLMLKKEMYDKALKLLQSNLLSTQQTHYTKILVDFYSLLAETNWQLNNIDAASDFANKALNKGQSLGNAESKVRAYKILYLIAQQQQNYADALQYYIDYANADKAFLDEVQTRQLAFQMGQTQYIEQQNKIEQLDHQNRLLVYQQTLSKAEADNNRLFISLLILASTVLSGWAYRIKSQQNKLKYMAEYDDLTGIFTRAHFKVLAQSALDYCDHTEQDICCVVFDLDNFKQVNDSKGHACGDWVLKKTIEVCKQHGRKNDLFARLGGEEFCVILPGCNIISGMSFAHQCRKSIELINTSESGYQFNISASFGVTSAKLSGYKLNKMIADADDAMYRSKNNGRNRVSQHVRDLMKDYDVI